MSASSTLTAGVCCGESAAAARLFIAGPELSGSFAGYLSDESRLNGRADCLALPRGEPELAAALAAAAADRKTVTVSGARTGITGGAVPAGGCLLSCAGMAKCTGMRRDRESGRFFIRCQPGVTLADFNAAVAAKEFPGSAAWPGADKEALGEFRKRGAYFLPPDPTEKTASLGGMVACNASGARSFRYGPMRNHVSALRVILAENAALDLARGSHFAAPDGTFALAMPGKSARTGRIPSYSMPKVKNAAGYFAAPGMDLLDLFIGSEGTLGVITEIEVMLERVPNEIIAIAAFFQGEYGAVNFVKASRAALAGQELFEPISFEFFDSRSLDLLRRSKSERGADCAIPELPAGAGAAVCFELAASRGGVEPALERAAELIGAFGGDADNAWIADNARETERIREFRHALPETINNIIGRRANEHPGLTKLGTDFAVPEAAFDAMLAAYRETLGAAGLEYAAFGHIGDNHLHVNILPRDAAEYSRGREIYMDIAGRVVEWGGTVSAEHGIGKLKKPLLKLMYGEAGVGEMRALKKVFDPLGILNPGNLFD